MGGGSRRAGTDPDFRVLATLIGLALTASLGGQAIRSPDAHAATAFPAGFVIEPVVSGLDLPTAISFTSDGRMFIAQKNGVIRVFRNGTLLPTPFIDLSGEVNSYLDRGLVGMTTHPDFPQTPYLYALYTYDPPGVTDDGVGPRIARLERITANPAQLDVAATGPGARTVLLGRNSDASVITNPNTNATLTCWQNGAMVSDCIPQDSRRHAIGTVQFGPDGALYVGNGDSDRLPDGPQQTNTLIGAILRLDPATGNGLPSNPFYNGDPTSNVSKTWVYGLRNPFRFGFDRVSGELLIADVGQNAWESIYRGQPGMNYGWPCYEGGNHVYGVYQNTALCQEVYSEGPRVPVHTYSHEGSGASVTGGDWYHGTAYPAEYQGAYFFADSTDNWVKFLAPNGSGGYTVRDFASGELTSGIVHVIAGPDSNLYWVSITNGTVYRLRYTNTPDLPPLVVSLGFDEGSGTVASDSSALGNNADLMNGATWGSGRLGGGLAVDGVNDIAAVPNSSSLEGFTDAFTLSAWVRRPSSQSGWRAVVSRQLTTDSVDQFHLSFYNGQPRFGVNTTNGGNQYVGAGTAPLGQWVHLAGVYDGATIRLYVDGMQRASMNKTGSILSSSRPVLVAGDANGTDPLAAIQNLAGSVDEVRMYSEALSGAEIAALANPGTPPEVAITNPAGNVVVDVGTTVQFAATATDGTDGDLTDTIEWTGILHHNVHTHPDFLEPTTGGHGSVVLDDHGDDTFLELCATVTNSAGLSATDCVEVRPTTATVTIDSVPQGVSVSFEDITKLTPFTVKANVGGTRTLSAPQSSGCLSFNSWSDGGGATHEVVVGGSPQTYSASFTGSCGSGSNLLQNPGFETDLAGWTAGTIVTSPVHSGSKALRINARSSATQNSMQTIAVTGGATYQASGWLSVANLAGAARIMAQWRNASGTLLRTDTIGSLAGTAGWALRSATLTAPGNATEVRFLLRTEVEADNSGQAWYDDLSFGSPSSGGGTPDYVVEGLVTIPGNPGPGQLMSFQSSVRNAGTGAASPTSSARLRLDINNDGTFDLLPGNQTTSALAAGSTEIETWSSAWTATAGNHRLEICADTTSAIAESNETNNCTTLTFSVGTSNNLLQNPGFETDLAGWTAGTIVTSPVHSGSKALRINARSSATQNSMQTIAVTGGATYQASGWLSVANLAGAARIMAQWRNASGTLLRTDTIGSLAGTAGWALRSATLTAPGNATEVRFLLRTEVEADNSGQAWYDDLSFG